MIVSFADRDSERLFDRQPVRRFAAEPRSVMLRKLLLLDATVELTELGVPPGNRLEKLKGDRTGQHSVCVTPTGRRKRQFRCRRISLTVLATPHRAASPCRSPC
ncbi:type II toxin-antitoxin system RelE/ParE family toxin [Gemmatimonas sp.]|uniref:type II toxin-antitoxin system RelE/ParE family toxin n=1 Tax=Gemmatimonas sp. TaxID=1962908 RepID=UPI003982F4A9